MFPRTLTAERNRLQLAISYIAQSVPTLDEIQKTLSHQDFRPFHLIPQRSGPAVFSGNSEKHFRHFGTQ
jgi:hypothetical protein